MRAGNMGHGMRRIAERITRYMAEFLQDAAILRGPLFDAERTQRLELFFERTQLADALGYVSDVIVEQRVRFAAVLVRSILQFK